MPGQRTTRRMTAHNGRNTGCASRQGEMVWIVTNPVVTYWNCDVGAPFVPNQSHARTCTGPFGTFFAIPNTDPRACGPSFAGTTPPLARCTSSSLVTRTKFPDWSSTAAHIWTPSYVLFVWFRTSNTKSTSLSVTGNPGIPG